MWLILLSFICILVIFTTLWYIIVNTWYRTSTKERIVILTKFPKPGVVKTRLICALGEAGAARAQLYMSDRIFDVVAEFQWRRSDVTVEVQLCGGSREQIKYWLERKPFPRRQFRWSFQCDGHLGLKMASALNKAFNEGSELAVLIGSDVPSNSADILDTALSKLRSPDCEMILGQAKDGGYYLVGLRREVKERLGVLDGIFEGIEWSTPTVCQRQVEVAALLGVKVQLLPQILQDVNSSWIDYIEIIVSDGGSIDSTLGKVEDFAEKNPDLRIKMVRGSKGRGKQLNAGAREATGVNLLFLHADGRLPRAFDRHVLLTLAEPGTIAGAFNLGWDVLQEDKRNDCSWLVRAQLRLGQLMRLASYKFTETAFGDQGLFMSRQTFDKAGRFPPYRLMEDYEMAMNLQRHGHLKIIQDVFIIASARRLIKKGVWKVALINCLLILGYHISVHPDTLARFYYG